MVIFFSPCKGNHVSSLQKFELKLNTRWSNNNYIKYVMCLMKKAQSTEFNSMFKIHFIDYGKLRLKMGYFDFWLPPSIKNDFIIKHFISKLLTNAWFQYTVHCNMSLWTHIFNSPKSLSFKPQFFLCAATLHEAIIHLLYMFKEHYKNRKFEVSFTSFKKKKLHPYYRHLIMQFLCINANFITNKVTVLYIYM